MIELARDLVFALQRRPRGLIARQRGIEDFQRDVDAANFVVRAPDFTLPTRAKAIEQCVSGIQPASGCGSRSLCHGVSNRRPFLLGRYRQPVSVGWLSVEVREPRARRVRPQCRCQWSMRQGLLLRVQWATTQRPLRVRQA
jgi:hypothetical protein